MLAGEDAGQELDTDAGPAARSLTGYCTLSCVTDACDAGQVCSRDGICGAGCDQARPDCGPGNICDFPTLSCVPETGTCASEPDCPIFDPRLNERGSRMCTAGYCRFIPNPGTGSHALMVSSLAPGLLPVAVHRPSAGERITDAQRFDFQLSLPAEVMVLGIVDREFKSFTDARKAALWIAYVDSAKAEEGVTLSDGGAVIDGEWHAEMPILPTRTPLYFFALGYTEGKLVAASEGIPFTVGPPLPRPGDACPGVIEGQFCANDSALICVGGTCRTPCLSKHDCSAETRLCVEPRILPNVAARVCY